MTNEPDSNAQGAQPDRSVVSPDDIQHQEFAVSRFGGYRMRDVDEFLDRLTASTDALIAENERLRAGEPPIVGTADLDDVNRQADEIIQRARDEAARIVAEASGQAEGGSSSLAATATAANRSSVDAFLTQERDFLQSLAALVQGHAESVKSMARRARQASESMTVAPAAPPTSKEAEAAEEPDPAESPERPDDAGEAADPEEDSAATSTPAAPSRANDQGGEGDPALRELFWGEDN